eukprot:13136576-Alexandrium_andersonii.AAC.1
MCIRDSRGAIPPRGRNRFRRSGPDAQTSRRKAGPGRACSWMQRAAQQRATLVSGAAPSSLACLLYTSDAADDM